MLYSILCLVIAIQTAFSFQIVMHIFPRLAYLHNTDIRLSNELVEIINVKDLIWTGEDGEVPWNIVNYTNPVKQLNTQRSTV